MELYAKSIVQCRCKNEHGKTERATYTPTVTPVVPTAKSAVSTGKQGEIQRGTTKFKPGSNITTIDSYTLIDKDGKPIEKITVPNEGIYTIDPKTGKEVCRKGEWSNGSSDRFQRNNCDS